MTMSISRQSQLISDRNSKLNGIRLRPSYLHPHPAELFKPSPAADAPATTKIYVNTRCRGRSRETDELLKSPRPVKEAIGEAYRMLSDTQLG
ncbi:hypothetical protein M378DRAFT_800493 [Amanita muscaria Koide BX008]|uniref:Uncharacterized protein n=1 Tax=Amanita muscaria (strain Koide BX008) TaxID=946122 RepID=A0A0C2T6Q9_AMAMK|nr:hypothetical protein M378DRAFT_800493 [Amanita muscaria Koide BX008]